MIACMVQKVAMELGAGDHVYRHCDRQGVKGVGKVCIHFPTFYDQPACGDHASGMTCMET